MLAQLLNADASSKRSVDGLFIHINGNMSIHLFIDYIVYYRQEATNEFFVCYTHFEMHSACTKNASEINGDIWIGIFNWFSTN